MASRPKHVSTLSDKISGLKFMQRAKAVQEKSQAGQSQPASTPGAQEDHDRGQGTSTSPPLADDGNDEHWALPRSRVNLSKSKSTVSHEPGWNAWLIDATEDRGVNDEEDGAPSANAARRLFGSWTKRGKKRKEDVALSQQDIEPDFEEEDDDEEEEEDEERSVSGDQGIEKRQEKRSSGGKAKGFIKPASYKESQADKAKRREIDQAGGDKGRSRQDTSKAGAADKRSAHFKGRDSRANALSGFPEQSRPPKTKKQKKL